jgi:hypothetical protein
MTLDACAIRERVEARRLRAEPFAEEGTGRCRTCRQDVDLDQFPLFHRLE